MFVISAIVNTLLKLIKTLPSSDPIEMRKMRARYRFVVFQTSMFVMGGIIVWTPGTILRIWQYAYPDQKSPYTLIFFHSLFAPSQGFFNFLIYVFPLQAQRCCFFICKIGKREETRDSTDSQPQREIQLQKKPISRKVGRGRARSVDSMDKDEFVNIVSLQKFYMTDMYTLFANDKHRSTAESISSRGSTLSAPRTRFNKAVKVTRSEPVDTNRLAVSSFNNLRDLKKQQRLHYKSNKRRDYDDTVEVF